MRDRTMPSIDAIVTALLQCQAEFSAEDRRIQEARRFVNLQYSLMPDYARWGLSLLLCVFECEVLLRRRRRVRRLGSAELASTIDRWRRSRFGALRNFVRFHESLAVFGWYAASGVPA